LVGFSSLFAASCGGNVPPPGVATATAAAALTAADKTHAARAVVYAAKATRYREAAVAERQQAAVYGGWPPKAGKVLTTNWNDKLKANHERRAAAADQIASRIQVIADFHATEASKEVAR
jgi:hypothetical protein